MSAAQTVRDIIEASRYLVLATADASGRPWSSPVYFAHIGFAEFYWVSSPEVTHSGNIAVRPEVGIVIFDSQVAIGAGQGVYMSAAATLLEGDEAARGIEAFSRPFGGPRRSGLDERGCPARCRPAALPGHRRLALDPRQGRPARPSHSRAAQRLGQGSVPGRRSSSLDATSLKRRGHHGLCFAWRAIPTSRSVSPSSVTS